jgi:hypothetical protein
LSLFKSGVKYEFIILNLQPCIIKELRRYFYRGKFFKGSFQVAKPNAEITLD